MQPGNANSSENKHAIYKIELKTRNYKNKYLKIKIKDQIYL